METRETIVNDIEDKMKIYIEQNLSGIYQSDLDQYKIAYILINHRKYIRECAESTYEWYEENDRRNLSDEYNPFDYDDFLDVIYLYVELKPLTLFSNHLQSEIPITFPSLNKLHDIVYKFLINKIIFTMENVIRLELSARRHQLKLESFTKSQIKTILTNNSDFIRQAAQSLYNKYEENKWLTDLIQSGRPTITTIKDYIDVNKQTTMLFSDNLEYSVPIIVSTPTLFELSENRVRNQCESKNINKLLESYVGKYALL